MNPSPAPFRPDGDLEALLRLAGEADRLDGLDVHPFAATTTPRTYVARAAGALAACLMLGVVAWQVIPSSLPPLAPRPGAVAANAPQPASPAHLAPAAGTGAGPSNPPTAVASARGAVVLSISEGEAGDLRCVAVAPSTWGDRRLAEISAEELQAAGLGALCTPDARRLLVIGLEGPRAQLPASDARALELARCMINTPACSGQTFDASACSTAPCVPGDVTIRVESIAMSKRP